MNYRHHFHAGNFADLVKHAALLEVRRALAADRPLTVIDTHAGAGVYDLTGAMALKSGEAQAGIARLMADPSAPQAFEALKAQVRALNAGGGLGLYPGSPWLVAQELRAHDRLYAFELRADDAEALRAALRPRGAQVVIDCADGFEAAPRRTPASGAVLVLIDPPFERADDYSRIAMALAAILSRNPKATVMVWAPLKDLETFDRLLRGLEALGPPPTLVAEARLRPLLDPMRMNGCALTIIHPPPGLDSALGDICGWVVGAEAGGETRVWRL